MSETPKGLMSVPEAARWLGMEGRAGAVRLRRYLLKLERQKGRKLMVRAGSGSRYLLTERILRKHAPELVPVRKRLPKEARRAVQRLRAELEDANGRIDDLEAKVFALAEELRRRRARGGP